MNININDEKFQEEQKEFKPIFNGGKAGVARNCSIRIEKKKDGDHVNAPAYKLYFIEENGAEIDDPLFDLKEGASEKQQAYWVKKMNYLQSQFGFKIANGAGSSSDILDAVAKGIHENKNGKKFGVAVGFGKASYPKSYLEIDGYWDFRNEDEITEANPLVLRPVILQTRLEPSAPQGEAPKTEFKEGSGDLPF